MGFLLGERSVRNAIRVRPPESSLRSWPPAHMPSPSPRCRAAPPLPSALRADGRGAWLLHPRVARTGRVQSKGRALGDRLAQPGDQVVSGSSG
jgi:hypothetical protein